MVIIFIGQYLLTVLILWHLKYIEQKILANVGFSVETSWLQYLIHLYIFLNAFFFALSLSSNPLIKVIAPNYCPQKTEMSYFCKEQSSQYRYELFWFYITKICFSSLFIFKFHHHDSIFNLSPFASFQHFFFICIAILVFHQPQTLA